MNRVTLTSLVVIGALLAASSLNSRAQSTDIDALKANMQAMQKSMEDMQKKDRRT